MPRIGEGATAKAAYKFVFEDFPAEVRFTIYEYVLIKKMGKNTSPPLLRAVRFNKKLSKPPKKSTTRQPCSSYKCSEEQLHWQDDGG